MGSPQKRMILEMRAKRALREDYKGLAQVPKGEKLSLREFTVRPCKQFDQSGKPVNNPDKQIFTLCAHYKCGSFNYYTYLPTEFQSEVKADVEAKASCFNDGMKNEPLYFVYYGKAGNRHIVDFLDENEVVDQTQLEDCAKELNPSPTKKPKLE